MSSCTIMNITGDITISWDDSSSIEIKEWIEKKINEGYTFFLIEKKCLGLFSKKTNITKKEDLMNKKGEINLTGKLEESFNKISLSADEGIQKLSRKKLINAKRNDLSNIKTTKVIQNLEVILVSDTLCVKPMMGG